MSQEPTFTVGGLPVFGDTILSPMAGYSDVPYRALCRAYGSAMHYTEFVPVEALLGRRVHPRFRRRLDSQPREQPGEHPMVFQIFGNDAQKLLEAALRIQEWGPDIIDINMGCATRKVSGRGAGVGMMPQPALIAETFKLLTDHLQVPVTGKIRLGWDATQQNFLQIGRILQDNGAALIAMHARTKVQKYGGEANWDCIAELKQTVSVPVIGNGDVKTVEDIDRMKAHSGCDAVMIGRAAIGNPWIFARKRREDISIEELVTAVRLHAREMVNYYGELPGLRQFRKHLKRYFADIPGIDAMIKQMLNNESLTQFEAILLEVETAVPNNAPLKSLMVTTV
ncbi:tRNA-dihydrouridine synthase DusB [hydrothermal vent metagenome]|uniref:tRNA-dihydrouridine synthase DusB n=1 Tax=hydrothermal vent metagenome TaxID=652676 RepID=A0A3B0WAI9_9ZZZZ